MQAPPGPPSTRVQGLGAPLALRPFDYRLVPGRSLAVEDADSLRELAATHGAVVFEVMDAEGDWLPGALFAVDADWSLLASHGKVTGIETGCRGDRTMALIGWESCDSISQWDAAPALGAPETLTSRPDDRGLREWSGSGFRLGPHPIVPATPRRDWHHAAPRGWGPMCLTVEVARSAIEIARFVESWAPMPYVPSGGHAWREPSGHERAAEVRATDGALHWIQSYPEPSDAVRAFDAGLLERLANEALGPLRWSFDDDDYGQRIASGADARSLAAYLMLPP